MATVLLSSSEILDDLGIRSRIPPKSRLGSAEQLQE